MPVAIYHVRSISSPLNGPPWQLANGLNDFFYPWEADRKATLSFRALHDEKWLYCRFDVTSDAVQVYADKNVKQEVLRGDRVEIFLSVDKALSTYYGLEVDPIGRVYDYRAKYHRVFNDRWHWPKEHLRINTEKSSMGYSVEIHLSINILKELRLLDNRQLICGLFRGACPERVDDVRWISWQKPDSPLPDFHVPSAFGVLELQGDN